MIELIEDLKFITTPQPITENYQTKYQAAYDRISKSLSHYDQIMSADSDIDNLLSGLDILQTNAVEGLEETQTTKDSQQMIDNIRAFFLKLKSVDSGEAMKALSDIWTKGIKFHRIETIKNFILQSQVKATKLKELKKDLLEYIEHTDLPIMCFGKYGIDWEEKDQLEQKLKEFAKEVNEK